MYSYTDRYENIHAISKIHEYRRYMLVPTKFYQQNKENGVYTIEGSTCTHRRRMLFVILLL